MCSSLFNHDAKVGKGQTEKRQKEKNKENPRVDCIRHSYNKNNIENNNLYDAWTVLSHDACSNAMRIVQLHFKNTKLAWT